MSLGKTAQICVTEAEDPHVAPAGSTAHVEAARLRDAQVSETCRDPPQLAQSFYSTEGQ